MTLKALTAAAEAVRDARSELQRLDGQAASLRQKLEEMDGQNVALSGLEERRAKLLEEALLTGRKADTGEVDKLITTAQRAIERRKDERIAIERALPALRKKREDAEATLAERRSGYDRTHGEHIAACVRKAVPTARELGAQFMSAIADMRACVHLMPETPERWALDSEVDALLSDLELFEITRDPSWATTRIVWTGRAAGGPATSQAQAALDQARELAGITEEPAPAAPVVAETPDEWVWSDGSLHSEPEPAPSGAAVRVIRANRESPVGLVETHPDPHYVPGLVRSGY